MKKLYNLIALTLVLVASHTLRAQDYMGYSIGSWAGINSLHLNPANVVDSRYSVDINLVTANFNVGNDFVGIDKTALLNGSLFIKGDPANPNNITGIDKAYMKFDTTSGNRSAFTSVRVQGPSFMFGFGKKKNGIRPNGIAFTTNARVMVNADDLSNPYTKWIARGFNNNLDEFINFNEQFAQVGVNAWAEYGLTYGRVIYDNNQHFLKVGGTLKLLQGITAAYLTVRNMTYNVGADSIQNANGQLYYGQTTDFYSALSGQGNLPSFRFNGIGFGGDLGVVYEWRPKYANYKYDMDGETGLWMADRDAYTLKASLALTDIGSIGYTRAGGTTLGSFDFNVNTQNIPVNLFVNSPEGTIQNLDSAGAISVIETNQKYFGMELPISLVGSVDYQPVRGLYLNFTPRIAFRTGSVDNSKIHDLTSFQFNVRYENPWFGAYMPIGYTMVNGFNWGIGLRLGPIHFGSGSIFSNLIRENIYAADAYVGVRIPIVHTLPSDADNDKVSDRKDECPSTPGIWEFKGCPDTDRDGIQDTKDECPTEPGIAEFNGCPDTDGDKIKDKDDKCPTEAGSKELQGCPDRDFDGVIDREDDCPDDKGLAQFQGCPDVDGDGTMDKLDQCPTLPGPKDKFGCPDTDNDGVYDNVDQCPTEPGLAELKGCPYADTDKDGIKDIDDACPNTPGPVENKGCPYNDSDGDGIIDLEDKCPKTPGVRENFGCPPIDKAEEEVIKRAFDNLEFNTGKSTIRSTSFASLDDLAKLLIEKPKYKLVIQGHTDNKGKRSSNITLSKNRANAVKNYLVSKGVAADRFTVEWFGPDRPVADNNTEEGRQRNRRVEMTLGQ